MKKQRFIWMLAAILTLSGATMTLTSCRDDEPSIPEGGTDPLVEKTEDELAVTTEKSYTLFGEWDEEFGQAFGRRLQGAMSSPATADIIVIDPSSFAHSSINNDDLKTIIRRSETGEASIVLTKATFREFYDWAQLYVLGYLLIAFEDYNGDHGVAASYDSPEAAPMRKKVANMIRNAYITSQQHSLPSDRDGNGPRRTSVNGMELDWEHVKDWPEEKQNAIMFDGFAQSEGDELFVLNAEACLVAEDADARIEQPDNDYEWGLKADAVADWLNRQDYNAAQRRAGLKRLARAVTSSGGSADISDLMSAQTKEFVFDYQYPWVGGNPSTTTAYSAIKVQYRAYSAYDFSNDKEYYQVMQNITVMNDKIHSVANDNTWFVRTNDGDFNIARGAWMKSITTKMWLEGSGSKSIVSVAPLNENGTSSGSSSSGTSTTTTSGSSDGISFGVSGGISGFNPTFSVSEGYSHTWSYSTSKGQSWNTSTNWSTRDLTTNCVQSTGADGTVTWTHSGNVPRSDYDATRSENVKLLLKSTCVTDENVLWMIDHPSGSYTLKANFNVVSEICKLKQNSSGWENRAAFVPQDNPHEISFDLWTPDRFKAVWNNTVYDYGNATGDPTLASWLDNFLMTHYGKDPQSGIFCWSGYFTSTESTANGSENARAVFQTFKNSIAGMKIELYQKGFRGKLVFGLKRDGTTSLIDRITLDLDDLYNVGETWTELVNDYPLTFTVTKNDEEVELTNVPSDFTGHLDIPDRVGYGISMKVTSLGNNCAVGRKGITAVTIPSTVQTIENGALAELNITSINIPEGVTYIGTWAFHADNELTAVSLPSTLRKIDNYAFCDLEKLTEINIPEGVTEIGEWAFTSDKELTKVYLPSTLQSIAYGAFNGLDKLAEVHIKATTPPTLSNYIFYPRYDDAVLYVPNGYKQVYAAAAEWLYFKNIVEE